MLKTKPKRIKVFDVWYKIQYVDNPASVDRDKRTSLWGQIDYWTRTIRIYDNGRPFQDVWQTIWHELIHGIVQHLHIKFTKDDEEDIVDRLALGLNCFAFDNGLLVEPKGK